MWTLFGYMGVHFMVTCVGERGLQEEGTEQTLSPVLQHPLRGSTGHCLNRGSTGQCLNRGSTGHCLNRGSTCHCLNRGTTGNPFKLFNSSHFRK
ncbi:hypothetical protein NHX12_030023 [Muraenolepis orangiensis]|uniref:Secreted protein n=1 Tax=Muraenolepis orangiensis TaxID=630683 RepID=A0A9Q0E917_9TELE|nr:hypothetical protein NHX12_030023 [Muraenolepis orangiensis]